jgi:DNA-binding MarR family transcriptional regulator
MRRRKKTGPGVEAAILIRSRRRCCVCFGLNRDVEIKSGQIAHLDGDRSNNTEDNLAFLCLPHHDHYDSRTSQSKNFTIEEVKSYRAELYDQVLPAMETRTGGVPIPTPNLKPLRFDKHRKKELKTIAMEMISQSHGILRNVHHLAHRLGITTSAVEQLLFELAQEGTLRVDRPSGTTRKTYSMVTALENRLIDTFKCQLRSTPISDERFIRKGQHELDALIRTRDRTTYALETMCVAGRVSREAASFRIRRLVAAMRQFSVPDAVGVLLIGITAATKASEEELKTLEQPNLLIRYVELEDPQYTNFKAAFKKSMDEVQGQAASTGLTQALQDDSKSSRLPKPVADQIARISEISPRAGISEAWSIIEELIGAVRAKHGLQNTPRTTQARFRDLVNARIVKKELEPIYDELREVRNNATHLPGFVVTPIEAQRFHFWVGVLYGELKKIAGRRRNPNKPSEAPR